METGWFIVPSRRDLLGTSKVLVVRIPTMNVFMNATGRLLSGRLYAVEGMMLRCMALQLSEGRRLADGVMRRGLNIFTMPSFGACQECLRTLRED